LSKDSHELLIFPGSKKVFVTRAPKDFNVAKYSSIKYSSMDWSPGGEALAVVESDGRRIWIMDVAKGMVEAAEGF